MAVRRIDESELEPSSADTITRIASDQGAEGGGVAVSGLPVAPPGAASGDGVSPGGVLGAGVPGAGASGVVAPPVAGSKGGVGLRASRM